MHEVLSTRLADVINPLKCYLRFVLGVASLFSLFALCLKLTLRAKIEGVGEATEQSSEKGGSVYPVHIHKT